MPVQDSARALIHRVPSLLGMSCNAMQVEPQRNKSSVMLHLVSKVQRHVIAIDCHAHVAHLSTCHVVLFGTAPITACFGNMRFAQAGKKAQFRLMGMQYPHPRMPRRGLAPYTLLLNIYIELHGHCGVTVKLATICLATPKEIEYDSSYITTLVGKNIGKQMVALRYIAALRQDEQSVRFSSRRSAHFAGSQESCT